jgi:hypothetical protein
VTRIFYLQRTRPLADLGVVLELRTLPQDEHTAAVGLAALLTRDHVARWPAEYSAVLDLEDGSTPTIITEEDPRVIAARALLLTINQHGTYHADELARVRYAITRPLRRL